MRSGTITKPGFHVIDPATPESRNSVIERTWKAGLIFSLLAAAFSALLGAFFGMDELLGLIPEGSWMRSFGTACFAGFIFLVFCAAHCLDKIRELRIAERKERVESGIGRIGESW